MSATVRFLRMSLFAMAETRSTKEAVQVIAQAIADAAPVNMDTPMLTPAVKRAMSKSIEEKGVIDVKDVAGGGFPLRSRTGSHHRAGFQTDTGRAA